MEICRKCGSDFEVTEKTRDFLNKVSPVIKGRKYQIPEPTLCPDCRTQRRFTFRNERHLYKTKSALSGKEIISNIHPKSPWKVYKREEWYGDSWNGTDFGKTYDFNKTFFQQFSELQKEVPIMDLNTVNNENCQYSNYVGTSKNCFLIFGSVYCEECYYGSPYYCISCIDSLLVRNSELCYDCITCERCYECFFCQDCVGSQTLIMCYDCQNCTDCIGCIGLKNQHYQIFNKQYSKEEYQKIRASLNFCNEEKMQHLKQKFQEIKKTTPHRFGFLINTENCTGNHIYNSKNTSNSYDAQRCEDCSCLTQTIDQKDCHDCSFTEENELCYEYTANYQNQKCLFSISNHACNDILYSNFCTSSHNLFGCIGIKHGKYCILNKQYSKEEYEELVPKIIEQMKTDRIWGEFFEPSLSYFKYNETVAQEYFSLTKEEALKQNFSWRDADPKEYKPQKIKVPKEIKEVSKDIINEILACKECGKNYKIIPQEFAFYKKYSLPVPTNCPDCRHTNRIKLRPPRKLFNRTCSKCNIELKSSYSPDRPETILCEKCYLKEVY
jgi:hypothetical protein